MPDQAARFLGVTTSAFMSHWINQLDTWLKPNEPFMLAAVCDITGATPDASRGVLLLCGERAASNIINERRRQAVVNDAKIRFASRQHWCEISYPLGAVLSKENGSCCVVYQYFDTGADLSWITQTKALLQQGRNAWLAFNRSDRENSTATISNAHDVASLRNGVSDSAWPAISSIINASDFASENGLQTRLIHHSNSATLLLPIAAPTVPIAVLGRHRAAVELIQQLSLLPVDVQWYADDFSETDPAGPHITRHAYEDLSANTTALIIMSDDHERDLQLCERALTMPASTFVGCIGSEKKAALFRQQLLGNGVTPAQLEKLHIPVGQSSISSKHPAMIAASALAQLLTQQQFHLDDQLTIIEP